MFDPIDAKESDYLYIKNSQIINAGKGLFTAIDIFKNEIICRFKGEILNAFEAKRREALGEFLYFVNLPDGTTMDSKYRHCFAKYANDSNGPGTSKFKINTFISLDDKNNVCLIALRNIKAGEELFCSYGKPYWKKFSTHYSK